MLAFAWIYARFVLNSHPMNVLTMPTRTQPAPVRVQTLIHLRLPNGIVSERKMIFASRKAA